jgi:hypothetical protein
MAVVDLPEGLGLTQRAADDLRIRECAITHSFPIEAFGSRCTAVAS